MNTKDIKQIRGQLRQITEEVLPKVLTDALVDAIYKKLSEENAAKMNAIAEHAKATLDGMDSRQKDFQNMLLRQAANPVKPDVSTALID